MPDFKRHFYILFVRNMSEKMRGLSSSTSKPVMAEKLTNATKEEICNAIGKEFSLKTQWGNFDRTFDNHDIKQVQMSLEAEWKDPNDPNVLKADLRDYAQKTWWAMAA